MPATPSPPPSPPADSPPTSPQLHQQAVRHHERLQRHIGSPELRRVPSTSMALPLPSLPPPPPAPAVSASVTFNGHSFNHLPAQLASALANLPDLPLPSHRGQRTAYSLPVSYLFYF